MEWKDFAKTCQKLNKDEEDARYRRECLGKRAYTLELEAIEVKRIIDKKYNLNFDIYVCTFCGKYHHGRGRTSYDNIQTK